MYAIVATCAVAAAGLTVGITVATRTPTPKRPAGQTGSPPLVLDLGVRTDREAVALRRAANLYNAGKKGQAARIFDRYGSLDARIGASLSAWPEGFARLAALAHDHPESAVAQLHYGLGLYWRGDVPAAKVAWRAARKAEPDTSYAIRAEDLLYPHFPRGLPTFVPSFEPPAVLDRLSPPTQLAYLRRLAATDGERGKLLYGVALQRLGRQISALREFEAAAALAPRDPEPQVGGGGRPLRQGESVGHLLSPRPALTALPEESERALPPRTVPALARRRGAGADGAQARARPRTANAARHRGRQVPRAAGRNHDALTRR